MLHCLEEVCSLEVILIVGDLQNSDEFQQIPSRDGQKFKIKLPNGKKTHLSMKQKKNKSDILNLLFTPSCFHILYGKLYDNVIKSFKNAS